MAEAGGNGLNFRHYPTNLLRVLAIEPESHLRRLAEAAATEVPVPVVVVVDGVAKRPCRTRRLMPRRWPAGAATRHGGRWR